MSKLYDLKGRRFGRLLVIEQMGIHNTYKLWKCMCDCGNITKVTTVNLIGKNTKSCGCLRNDQLRTHGLYKHPLVPVWKTMKCRSENHTIDPDWQNDFKSFYDWAMENGWKEDARIYRLDRKKGYLKENCKIGNARNVTLLGKMQSNNTSGYIGVYYQTSRDRWVAVITIKGKHVHLGRYKDVDSAVKVRNDYILEHHIQHEYKIQELIRG